MPPEREGFIAPVGFAREPAVEVRRWIGRFLMAVLLVLLAFIVVNNVIYPSDDVPRRTDTTEGPLPGPI
ncbi:MAG TPA: hypothetical protein VGB52_06695 [Actinomycetota bacterium]